MKRRVITICGSMRNYNHMLAAANEMTKDGHIILMPFVLKVEDPDMDEELQELHRAKIDMSDDILVVGVPGASTEEEIAYAKQQGKFVRYSDIDFVP